MGWLASEILIGLILCFFMGLAVTYLIMRIFRKSQDSDLDDARLRIKKLESATSENERLRGVNNKLVDRIKSNDEELEKIPMLKQMVSGLKAKTNAYGELQKENVRYKSESKKLADIESKLPSLITKANKWDSIEPELEILKSKSKETERLGNQLNVMKSRESRVGELEQEISRLRLQSERVKELTASNERLIIKANKVDELQKKINMLDTNSEEVTQLEKTIIDLRSKANKANQLEQQVVDLKKESNASKQLRQENGSLKTKIEKLSGLEAEVFSLRQKKSEFENSSNLQEDVKEKDTKIATMSNKISQLKSKLGQSGGSKDETLEALRAKADRSVALEVEVEKLKAAQRSSLETENKQGSSGDSQELIDLREKLSRYESEKLETASLKDQLAKANTQLAISNRKDDEIVRLKRQLNGTPKVEVSKPYQEPDIEQSVKNVANEDKPQRSYNWSAKKTKLETPGVDHKDDLKVINGIGPVMETTLNDFDICSWEQLSAFTQDDIDKVTEAISTFPGRIERDNWVGQAKVLVDKHPLSDPYDRPTSGEDESAMRKSKPEANTDSDNGTQRINETQQNTNTWSATKTRLGTPGVDHKDDLKVVSGIGKVMEITLNGLDICSWEQIAAFTQDDIEKVTESISTFPGRIERDNWVGQAKELVQKHPLSDPYDRPTSKD